MHAHSPSTLEAQAEDKKVSHSQWCNTFEASLGYMRLFWEGGQTWKIEETVSMNVVRDPGATRGRVPTKWREAGWQSSSSQCPPSPNPIPQSHPHLCSRPPIVVSPSSKPHPLQWCSSSTGSHSTHPVVPASSLPRHPLNTQWPCLAGSQKHSLPGNP